MKHLFGTTARALSIAVAMTLLFVGAAQADGSTPWSTKNNNASSAVPAQERARLIDIMQKKLGMTATNVEFSPIPDFYEMTVRPNIYYMDKNGKWLIDGHLVDVDTKTSVTAQKKAAMANQGVPVLDWRSLNLADAIKTTRGQAVPGRVLVTFEDPNCGYCKKLQPELAKLQNITIYTFPIAILGPNSQSKNEAVWCSKNRATSWANVFRGVDIKAETECDTSALKRNGELAQRMAVSGTPTMFLADGSRIPGYVDSGAIEAKLSLQQK